LVWLLLYWFTTVRTTLLSVPVKPYQKVILTDPAGWSIAGTGVMVGAGAAAVVVAPAAVVVAATAAVVVAEAAVVVAAEAVVAAGAAVVATAVVATGAVVAVGSPQATIKRVSSNVTKASDKNFPLPINCFKTDSPLIFSRQQSAISYKQNLKS